MGYNTIPDDVLDRIEAKWPHLAPAIRNLREVKSPMQARQYETHIATNVLISAAPLSGAELYRLSSLDSGKPYGAHSSTGKLERMQALHAQGLGYQAIADRLGEEGYGEITKAGVQLALKRAVSN